MSVEQTSINQLITDNIDVWSSTVKTKSASGRGSSKKRELYGVKKLRELILELAVRGKLVPQDPTDEPASVLLERVAAEKAQLIKDKKIKKNRKQSAITQEEIYFSVHKSWAYARLEDVYDVRDGTHDSPKPTGEGYPLVTSKNLSSGKLDLSEVKLISEEDHMKVIERSRVDRNDILFAMIGSIGNPVIVDTEVEFSIKNVGLFKYYNPQDSSPNYLNYFLKYAAEIMKKQSAGGVQPFVSLGKLRGFVMPTPPLAEQHRIVAKVDELMTLCDQLEQQTEASIEAHQVLVTTLLDTLTSSDDADELMQNWGRISEHFDTLFTTEASIDQLKQTILQLAVMGKLVPQDPNDEPAAKLLERIAEEKAQLIKDKKIKNQKVLPPIADDEKLFGLANGWCFVRLDDICTGITSGSTPPKDKFIESEGVPYLKVYNIRNQKIDFSYKEQFVDSAHHTTKLTRSILYPGDVVMNIVGPPLGKIAIIPDSYPEWNCNQAIVVFRPIESLLNKYIYTYLTAGLFLQSIELIGTAGQDNISVTKSRSIVMPMPPLEEQHRIFARVEELMVVCDELKARLKESQITQLHLTDAFVDLAL